jgi:hypothetical protein
MTFALAGNLITQTGTDANLSGLAAIAGVVTRVEGAGSYIKTRYYLPAGVNLTYAILTIDPRKECLIFGAGGPLLQAGSAASVLTIGAQITQNGGIYSHLSEAVIFTSNNGNAYQVNQGFKVLQGTLNWYSGIIRMQEGAGFGAFQYDNGGAAGTLKGYIGKYATLEVMAPPSGQTNESCQMQFACDPGFIVDGMVVKGYGSTPPSVLISLSSATVYTTPFAFNLQGAGGITAQSAARQSNFANFYGLQTTASPKGFNLFLGSMIRGINQELGSAVVVVEHNVDASHGQGYVELRNEFDATIRNVAGALQAGVVVYCRDTNNGKRQAYTQYGQNISNLADKVYLAATSAAGNVKFAGLSGSILLAAVTRNTLGLVNVDDTGLNAKDYRSISGTKGADDFAFYYWGYSFLPQNSVEILKTNKVAKFVERTMLTDANVTLSEAAAVAKLASSFIVAGNTLTVTADSTLDDLYDAMKAYKTRAVQAQVEYPSIGVQPVTATGKVMTTAMNIAVAPGTTLSAGTKFTSFTTTGTVSGLSITVPYTDANANSYLAFENIDSWTVYSDPVRTVLIGSGTGTGQFKFNYNAGVPYYLTLTIGAEGVLKSVMPVAAGETMVSLSPTVLLSSIKSKALTLAQLDVLNRNIITSSLGIPANETFT